MKLIPITLTLPGIAGLILTIGVAADANIVIFERIKEEARAGHSMPRAITAGYRKGIATIIDANVITLLTAFILFVLATAGVKGFAFTLGVGTLVSLFTAVVFTRACSALLGRTRFLSSPALLGAGRQRRPLDFDFAGASKWFFSISGVILADRRARVRDLAAQLRHRLRVRHARSTAGLAEAGERRRGPQLARRRRVDDAEGRSRRSTSPSFGDNVFQIQGTISTRRGRATVADAARQATSALVRADDADGFDNQSVGPTFGEQVARSAVYAIIFSLLADRVYVALPLRVQVRGSGADRRDPRRPDHRRLYSLPGGRSRARPSPRS